jgi:uncharacterized membrane protein
MMGIILVTTPSDLMTAMKPTIQKMMIRKIVMMIRKKIKKFLREEKRHVRH